MNSKAQTGVDGENRATAYLVAKGYKILERNYRYKRAEVDIIAQTDRILIFVEVKTKTNTAFGYPEEAVNAVKIRKVTEAADHYVYEKNWHDDIRFDIIAVNKSTGSIDHFEDAFY